jgi:hypothetical protein
MRPVALARPLVPSDERRRDARVDQPTLTVELEGYPYRTDNWSLGGFRLSRLHRRVAPGERFSGIARDPTGCMSGDIIAEAVWISGDRTGFHLLELSPRLRRALAAFRQA